jgi:glycosyltransferase involved in cell wall biosynthesis
MKILFGHYLLDDDNPPVRTNRAITEQLRALGHDVELHRSAGPAWTVRATDGGPSAVARRSAVQRFKDRAWFARASYRNRAAYRRDRDALARFHPDVVLVRHDPYWCSMAWAASRAGVPLVTYVDAPMAYETRLYNAAHRWHPPGVVEWFERQALAPSRLLTATSHPTAQKVREDYAVTVPIRIIANGLHPDRFPPRDEASRSGRLRELGIAPSACVVGFQGTFKPFHGIDRLRELILATASRSDVHWLLIGDGPERASLEASVAGRSRATFLGRRDPAEMGRLLSLFDVAVVPHEFVPGIFYLSPLKVIECAAAGCAVVASSQGDIPWLLDDGRAGVVLDTPDLDAWSAAIMSLAGDPARRQSLGEASRRHVLEHFTWRQIAEQYAEALTEAVGAGRA